MMSDAISQEELEQYDRQIRLWGVDAQKRLKKANILVIGLGGLGSEIVKNIVLTGVHSITLCDTELVTEEDLLSQLLVTPESLGQNIAAASRSRTCELNPNVIVVIDTDDVITKDPTFFDQFDVVTLTRSDASLRIKLNEICRSKNICFFCSDVFGFYGYGFFDHGKHEFAYEVPVKRNMKHEEEREKIEDTATVMKTIEYCSYKDALKEDWSRRSRKNLRNSSQVFFILQIIDEFKLLYGRLPRLSDQMTLLTIKQKLLSQKSMKEDFVSDEFSTSCFSVLSPVSAIVGGVIGQEIIKAISKKDEPHRNFFFYDGTKHLGIVDHISP